jgi:ArsR family transcriptional regulator
MEILDQHLVQLFRLQAEVCKTLADPTRLWILYELKNGEMSVGQLVSGLGIPQSSVSRHLAVLREREVVATRREGTTIFYSLTDHKIAEACELVREVIKNQLVQRQGLVHGLKILSKLSE